MRKRGYFITFEGPDGSGKTTVSKAVYEHLKEMGVDAIYTREPGGIDIAEQIRNVILDPRNTAMDQRTEALLYAASRRQHLVELVLPALKKNQIVLCDRFVDSSLAYQGFGRHLGIDEVFNINYFATDGLMPDKTIFLDLSAEEGLKRIENRVYKDRLDQESLNFHFDVVKGYQEVVKRFSDRMVVIDASKNSEEVINEALVAVMAIING
ncbi:MAG: dTMP kinase [Anaerorhabdus sp.]